MSTTTMDPRRLDALRTRLARLAAEHAGLREAATQAREEFRELVASRQRFEAAASVAARGARGRSGDRDATFAAELDRLDAELAARAARADALDAEARARFADWTAQARLVEACEAYLRAGSRALA